MTLVRKTVDLPLEVHEALRAWQDATAHDLDRARVTFQAVAMALITELLADDALGSRVYDRLR